MNLWGLAVLELDRYPDHNKGPDHVICACPKTNNIIDPSFTTYQPFDCTTLDWRS